MKKIISAGLLTAAAASLCCIAPVVALIAGTSSAASAFSWLEPFRPYFISLTILLLGFSWHQKFKPQKTDECDCDTITKQKFSQTKLFLGLITIFAVLMITFPYYSKVFYQANENPIIISNKETIQEVELKIQGMTCAAWEEHIKHEVVKLRGIISADISYANSNAIIKFDTSKTKLKVIEKIVDTTGYKVTETKLK
ncbi:MAG: mercuric transport protein MerTP [Chitinophagaceae bacterium]